MLRTLFNWGTEGDPGTEGSLTHDPGVPGIREPIDDLAESSVTCNSEKNYYYR